MTECPHCNHEHQGAQLAFICIGCPCPYRLGHDFVDDTSGEGICERCGEGRDVHEAPAPEAKP